MFALDDDVATHSHIKASQSHIPIFGRLLPATIAASLLIGLGFLVAAVFTRQSTRPDTVVRLSLALPPEQAVTPQGMQSVAISPDGTQIVYVANRRLYVRSLSDFNAAPIAGAESKQFIGDPAFSPDGSELAFWSGTVTEAAGSILVQGALSRVPVTGGTPRKICDATFTTGITWTGDTIVFGQRQSIMRVSAEGGTPQVIAAEANGTVWDPQLLPSGDVVLFTVFPRVFDPIRGPSTSRDNGQVVVHSFRTGDRKVLWSGASTARYMPSGHFVYTGGSTLFAIRFDSTRLETEGGPAAVAEGISRARFSGFASGTAYYALSDTGSLVFIPGTTSGVSGRFDLALTDRQGQVQRLNLQPALYLFPRISPDGSSVAVGTDDGNDAQIWTYDLYGASGVRQLTSGGRNRFPVWSGDGQYVAFQSDRDGEAAIFHQRADGSSLAQRLTRPTFAHAHIPQSWSRDGRTLLFEEVADWRTLWALSVPDGKVSRFGGVTSSLPIGAAFSPDAQWVAYAQDEDGIPNLYVEPFPPTGVKFPIARFAWHPLWSPNGRELLYRTLGNQQEAVSIATNPRFTLGRRSLVTTSAGQSRGTYEREYDVTADGMRFITVVPADGPIPLGASQIHVVLNWLEELKQRVPTR